VTATARESRDLVGDVRRFGLFSAASVVDRYAVLVDRVLAAAPPVPRPQGAGADDLPGQLAETALRLLDSATALLAPGAPTASSTEPLVLPSTAPGGTAGTALWVHNATPSAVPAVRLRMTELLSAAGRTVPAAAVSLVPDRVDLPAEGAREVRLTVRVPPDQPPGLYHGLVLASASPDRPLVLRLEVLPPGDPGR
jgi:hypothetical protein